MNDNRYLIRNQYTGYSKFIFICILFALLTAITATFIPATDNTFESAKREILLRRIGHELLLQSGNSSSRVLPVRKITDNTYQIQFENSFSFQPDSLIQITQQFLAKDSFFSDYVVNVIQCNASTVVYGFAISKNKKEAIITCKGRKLPKACYSINVILKQNENTIVKYKYFLIVLLVFLLVGFIFLKRFTPKKVVVDTENHKQFNIGSVIFDVEKQLLIGNDKTVNLTKTETRLLLIFSLSPNEIIERSRLQKEIWEDKGVIVGRSLDMFISKLRKKLEFDAHLNIAVVRGKGYKLEVTT